VSTRLRILIVEDNAQSRFLFATALRRAGHEVVEADSGEKAVLLASLYTPDLILLDIGLPGMSGRGVAAELHSHPDVPHCPIIAVTGGHISRDERQALGLTDVIYKPVLPSELVARIDEWADRRSRADGDGEPQPPDEQPQPPDDRE
jgi:DNA-binding response OmpR family regulator